MLILRYLTLLKYLNSFHEKNKLNLLYGSTVQNQGQKAKFIKKNNSLEFTEVLS